MLKKIFTVSLLTMLIIAGNVSNLFSQSTPLQLVDVTKSSGISFVHNLGDDDMNNLVIPFFKQMFVHVVHEFLLFTPMCHGRFDENKFIHGG